MYLLSSDLNNDRPPQKQFKLDFSNNRRGWRYIRELFTFLVRIWLEFVKLGIFKPNLATLQALYFVTLVCMPRFDLSKLRHFLRFF